MASSSCHVVGGAKQVRLERIVRHHPRFLADQLLWVAVARDNPSFGLLIPFREVGDDTPFAVEGAAASGN